MATCTSSTNEYYALIYVILMESGEFLTRSLFLKRVEELSPDEHDFSVDQQLLINEFLTKNKTIILQSNTGQIYQDTIYPPSGKTNIDEWDLHLLCFILQEVCNLKHINKKDMEKLSTMANKLRNLSPQVFDEDMYEERLEKIKEIVSRTCEKINDTSFTQEINDMVQSYEKECISSEKIMELYQQRKKNDPRMPDLFTMLENQTKGNQSDYIDKANVILKRMENIGKRLPTGGNSKPDERAKAQSLAEKCNLKSYRPPKEACRYDGRLILLSNEDINEIKQACTQEQNVIGKGGFGTVYKKCESGFGMSIAIKKIVADNDEKKSSVIKEIFGSRILHPFILPLFSMIEDHSEIKTDFYFISPYFERGDLYIILAECRKNQESCSLNQMQRTRIALQLSLAIEYLHTPVHNVRGIVLHKDICSSNVVLDRHSNARLIDFGLAREKDDMTASASGKVPYHHPDVGKQPASVLWDYYSLGVVIRELLTGLPPSGKEPLHLRFMQKHDIMSNLASVWDIGDNALTKNAKALITAAERCINAKEENFEITKHVIDEIKGVFKESIMNKTESNKCVLCMINPNGSEAAKKMEHGINCNTRISLCVACERNSFLNPVTCYSCRATLEPIIGYGWGALLVAGNDQDSDENANAFKTDMESMRKVFISRAPLVMGIREEHVRVVALREPGENAKEEILLPLVMAAVDEIRNMDIHTLVVYFSCHGGKNGENFFQLASKQEKLTFRDFQELLSNLTNVEKVIVILDRCFADKLTLSPDKVVVQINACGRDECAPVQEKESPFTKYLIKGLYAITNGKVCEKDNIECKCCENYWATRNDYITVGSLLEFVASHMESKGFPKPNWQFNGNADDFKIAYYTDEEVYLEFTEDGDRNQDIKQVPLAFCQNMDELKMQLLKTFNNDTSAGKDLEVCIKNDTYRKENRLESCDTIDKVMMAWILRKRLVVKMEERAS